MHVPFLSPGSSTCMLRLLVSCLCHRRPALTPSRGHGMTSLGNCRFLPVGQTLVLTPGGSAELVITGPLCPVFCTHSALTCPFSSSSHHSTNPSKPSSTVFMLRAVLCRQLWTTTGQVCSSPLSQKFLLVSSWNALWLIAA